MKVLKKIGFVLLVLIALFFITAAFVKKDFSVTKNTTVDKPKSEVFAYIKMLENQDEYSVWQQMDPNMKKSSKGTDGTVGYISSWVSNHEDVGSGEQEIMKIDEGNRMDVMLRFKEPWESEASAYFTTEDDNGKTKVTWGFNGSMPYPWNIMLLFMDMEERVGNDLQTGLDNLKKELESRE